VIELVKVPVDKDGPAELPQGDERRLQATAGSARKL
jgi:hypothetical protein